MRDLLLIACYAAAGSAVAGVLGAVALRAVRRRSVALSLAVPAVVAVGAMLAGTLSVAWAMFLSSHDLAVITMVCAVAAATSTATALLLGRRVSRAHRRLEDAAGALGDGQGFQAPDAPMPAELASLARRLTDTSVRLTASREREAALEASRRELVAWISHDLRSPLAGLRAMAEALEDGMTDEPARYHRRMRTEVERLTEMVNDLFELSRIQAGSLAPSLARISAYDLVGDAIAGAHPLAAGRGVRLTGDGVQPLPLRADGNQMSRVLANLLVNAIHRTPADGTVAVSAREVGDTAVLAVTDGCGGIPADELHRVFDTGWRGEHARTPPAGAGLGLAIVRGIVEAHAGCVSVRNIPGGCRFEVTLPLARRTVPRAPRTP